MYLYKPLGQKQTYTGTSFSRVFILTVETLEEVCFQVVGYSVSRVCHRDVYFVILFIDSKRYKSSGRSMLNGIRYEIIDYLFHKMRVEQKAYITA